MALNNILGNIKMQYNKDAATDKDQERPGDTTNKNTKDNPMLSTSTDSIGYDEQNSPLFRSFEQVNDPLDSQYQAKDSEEAKNNGKNNFSLISLGKIKYNILSIYFIVKLQKV